MADAPTDVLVAGGGIGGLSLALALHARGVRCHVVEAAREVRPLGVGINLLPHAVRVLDGLDLAERLAPNAVETAELAYYNRHGQPIWSEPRGRLAGYAHPQFSVHRGTLQLLLYDAVRERLGSDAVLTGHAVGPFDQDADGVAVHVAPRDGEPRERQARLLVGADGIHSTVRAALHPGDAPVRYGGRMLWRAITRGRPFLTGRSMIMAGHQDQKFVCYPISAPGPDGRQDINWIAELAVARDAPPRQDWSREVDRSVFRAPFADWRFPWLDVPALIDGAPAAYEYPLADRDPLLRWTTGRATLLGDAAHAMYPIGSNGASQAILDAEALAAAIASAGCGPQALAAYEDARREPTTRIVLANRGNGPEQVMQLAEERAPEGFADVHDVIARAELEEIAARYKRLAGFAPDQVNAPSH